MEMEGVKAAFGKESAEVFILLRFPTFDAALKFVKQHRDSIALQYKDKPLYLSLNNFGRVRVAEIFLRKALQVLRDHEIDLGIVGCDIKPSWASGGINIDRRLVGHVLVSPLKNQEGQYDITWKPNAKEADEVPFDLVKFQTLWSAKCRF